MAHREGTSLIRQPIKFSKKKKTKQTSEVT